MTKKRPASPKAKPAPEPKPAPKPYQKPWWRFPVGRIPSDRT